MTQEYIDYLKRRQGFADNQIKLIEWTRNELRAKERLIDAGFQELKEQCDHKFPDGNSARIHGFVTDFCDICRKDLQR